MQFTYLYPLVSVLIVSAISLIGVFALSLQTRLLSRGLFVLVSLAVGALLGDAFLHLIPEAYAEATSATTVSLLVIGGVLLFFLVERFLHWHHHEGVECEQDVHPVGKIVLLSDGIHNLIDGLIIGLAYTVSIEVGIATTVAVILHEIPQEFGDFGVLLHAGYSKGRALFLNFISGLMAVLGALIALVLGEIAEGAMLWLIPVTAGGFIYIALADLIPELHKSKSFRHTLVQVVSIAAGVLAMVLLIQVEVGHEHGDLHEPAAHEDHADHIDEDRLPGEEADHEHDEVI